MSKSVCLNVYMYIFNLPLYFQTDDLFPTEQHYACDTYYESPNAELNV